MAFKPGLVVKLAAAYAEEIAREAEEYLVSSCGVVDVPGGYDITLVINTGSTHFYTLRGGEAAAYNDIVDIVDDYSGELTREINIARPRKPKGQSGQSAQIQAEIAEHSKVKVNVTGEGKK